MRSRSRRYGRGYSGYRGRSSLQKPLLVLFLLLIIALSAFVIIFSRNIVYDANGNIRFLLPESSSPTQQEEVPLDLTIEVAEPEPEEPAKVQSVPVVYHQLAETPVTQAILTALPAEKQGVAL